MRSARIHLLAYLGVAFFMPGKHAPDKLEERRERAIRRGFLVSRWFPIPVDAGLAPRVRAVARALKLHADHNAISGQAVPFARAATRAARDQLSPTEYKKSMQVHDAANAAKHAWADAWDDESPPSEAPSAAACGPPSALPSVRGVSGPSPSTSTSCSPPTPSGASKELNPKARSFVPSCTHDEIPSSEMSVPYGVPTGVSWFPAPCFLPLGIPSHLDVRCAAMQAQIDALSARVAGLRSRVDDALALAWEALDRLSAIGPAIASTIVGTISKGVQAQIASSIAAAMVRLQERVLRSAIQSQQDHVDDYFTSLVGGMAEAAPALHQFLLDTDVGDFDPLFATPSGVTFPHLDDQGHTEYEHTDYIESFGGAH